MKHTRKILLSSLLVIAAQFAATGCVGYGGGGGGGDVAYGPDVWVHDSGWVDGGGRGWYGRKGGDAYVHPASGGGHAGGGGHAAAPAHDSGGGGHTGGGDHR